MPITPIASIAFVAGLVLIALGLLGGGFAAKKTPPAGGLVHEKIPPVIE
jgi:hypothetical protein